MNSSEILVAIFCLIIAFFGIFLVHQKKDKRSDEPTTSQESRPKAP